MVGLDDLKVLFKPSDSHDFVILRVSIKFADSSL